MSGLPLALLARLALGVSFLVMGWLKVQDPVAFLKLLREYDMLPLQPPWAINALAVSLPWLELWLGALVLLGVGTRGAALGLGALLSVFTAAIVVRSLGLVASEGTPFCEVAFDCGCGSGEVLICTKLAQNAGLLLATVVATLSQDRRWSLRARLLR